MAGKIDSPWKAGSMTFTNMWVKPPKVSMKAWLRSDCGRKWVSKKGETPANFISRVLKDMEKDGAQITEYLLELIKKAK